MFKNLNPSALGVTGHQSEIIELALTYGFRGMDFSITEFATRAKLKGMPYARRLIDSAGIGLTTFKLPLDWDTDDDLFKKDLESLPELAAVAQELGCSRCVAMLAPAGDKRPYHENFEFHQRRFAEICGVLDKAGIRFGIGFQAAEYLRKDQAFQFVHDFEALTLLMNMVGAPNMGVVLVVWDLVDGGGTVDAIRSLQASQIVSVRVSNLPADVAAADLTEDCGLLPDAEEGKIDVASVLRALKELGYDGPITPNPSPAVFRTRRREDVVKQASRSLDAVLTASESEPAETSAAATGEAS